MKELVVFLILITFIIDKIHANRLGYIRNGSYVTNDTKLILTFVNTCSECICDAFFSKIAPMYVGLNCYQSRKICELFVNYSSLSMITMNNDSMFIFLQLPSLQNKTTGTEISMQKNRGVSLISSRFFSSSIVTQRYYSCWLWEWNLRKYERFLEKSMGISDQ